MRINRKPRSDRILFFVLNAGVVMGAISILCYVLAAAFFLIQGIHAEISLRDLGNITGALAGMFTFGFVGAALLQEWRHRRGRGSGRQS